MSGCEALVGVWNNDRYENLEAFMDANSIEEPMRTLARSTKPTVTFSKTGNEWTMKTEMGDKVLSTSYPLGQAVDVMTLMGKPAKATMEELPDGVLRETQVMEGLSLVLDRSVVNGQYQIVMTGNGVSSQVYFNKAS